MESESIRGRAVSGDGAALRALSVLDPLLHSSDPKRLRLVHRLAILSSGTLRLHFFAFTGSKQIRRVHRRADLRIQFVHDRQRGFCNDHCGRGVATADSRLRGMDRPPTPRSRRQTSSLPWVILGGVALGFQIIAGHPEVVYYTLLIAEIFRFQTFPTFLFQFPTSNFQAKRPIPNLYSLTPINLSPLNGCAWHCARRGSTLAII